MTTVADGSYRERLLGLLGDQDPLEALEANAQRVEAVARKLGESGLSRSYGQPWDEASWARRYANVDVETALGSYRALRRWNLALFRGLSPADLDRQAFHPERGPETLASIIRLLAGHDLNHLAQLERLAALPGTILHEHA